MHTILPHIRQHFDGMSQKLDAFAEHVVHVESWFKGECLALATILHNRGVIDSVEREIAPPDRSGRVDLRLAQEG